MKCFRVEVTYTLGTQRAYALDAETILDAVTTVLKMRDLTIDADQRVVSLEACDIPDTGNF